MANKRYWKIAGYDGATQTFEKVMPLGYLSENQAVALLQRLAAMHLNEDEIISCSVRKNAPNYCPLLEPQFDRGGRRPTIVIYAGRAYRASVWAEHELS